ncbi:MAG TPA: glycerophosphodiester phosphodiesterase [Burkholderiaceae bacterium]|nr:glycerophosphodiester phosphodiesterase [Burkholderiaceae bacterium]
MSYSYFTRIYAHRGGGTLAPENTVQALQVAHHLGFQGVEFDVMLTADDEPVLMHDAEFGRTVFGTGQMNDTRWEDLQRKNAGAWFKDPRYAGARVPHFDQALAYCSARNMHMNVEIKPAPGRDARTGEVAARLCAQYFPPASGPAGMTAPLLSSFSAEALAAAAAVAPHLPRARLWRELPPDWAAQLAAAGCVAAHVRHDHLDEARCAAVKQAGFGLLAYTVNDPRRARELMAWGVDALCTDRLDLIGPRFR